MTTHPRHLLSLQRCTIRTRVVFAAVPVAAAGLVVLHLFWVHITTAPGPHSRLVVDRAHLLLGNGTPNEVLTGTFILTNTGSLPLRFDARPSCGCVQVKPLAATIPGHATCPLSAALRLPSYSGTQKSINIAIVPSEPDIPGVTLVLTGRTSSHMTVTPLTIDFGTIAAGSIPPPRDFEIAVSKPFPSFSAADAVIHPSGPVVLTQTKHNSQLAIWRVDLPRPLLRGRHDAAITITHPLTSDIIQLSVHACVEDTVSVFPEHVFLASAATPTLTTLILTTSEQFPKNAQPALLDSVPWVTLVSSIRLSDRACRLVLRADPRLIPQTAASIIRVGTKDPPLMATVRFVSTSTIARGIGPSGSP
jgi:hypothetical protein